MRKLPFSLSCANIYMAYKSIRIAVRVWRTGIRDAKAAVKQKRRSKERYVKEMNGETDIRLQKIKFFPRNHITKNASRNNDFSLWTRKCVFHVGNFISFGSVKRECARHVSLVAFLLDKTRTFGA
ncbi:PREDICTED: uncharacterized protein LOC105455804 [Wasmannia auropunctata]|uniref:uncharacterized protein LOC105455804 n=1 Tax=Wasmannia auropunctata TaxID=64793 RepID=UPI0005F0963E|nr:PREDICTED: uncharacterized protein LOC105455804 [Wasmannia auropunctata]